MTVLLIIVTALEKNIYNPAFIFCGTWLFVGTLSQMNLYYFNNVSNSAYSMALIGTCCFLAGCALRRKVKIKTRGIRGISHGDFNNIRYRMLIPFYFVILLFTVFMAMRSFSLLLRGVPMETIRFNYRSLEAGLIVRNAFEYDMEHYVVATSEFAGVGLFPVILMDKRSSRKYFLLIEMSFFFFLHIFVTGARSFVFDVIIVLFFYILIDSGMRRTFSEYFNKYNKKIIFFIAAGALLLFVTMTQMRRGIGSSIMHEFYSYFSICFRLLDTHLKLIHENPEFTYGMTALHGILRPFFLLLRAIGIPYPTIYSRTIELMNANNDFYAVGLRGSANSFVTLFYYFYMDFGYIGVLLGSFIYGYLSQSVYSQLTKKPDKRIQSIYLLWIIGLVLSFARLHFTAHRYIYAFVLIMFSFYDSRKSTLNI